MKSLGTTLQPLSSSFLFENYYEENLIQEKGWWEELKKPLIRARTLKWNPKDGAQNETELTFGLLLPSPIINNEDTK